MGWYMTRLRAMSPSEVAWRAGSELRLRLQREDGARLGQPRFDEPRWSQAVRGLADSRRDGFVADAERIAAGELDLWGRRIRIEGRAPAWNVHPFDGAAWPTSWRRWEHDPKPVWELHRQQHLFPLAAGAALAERRDWARLCVTHILDWIDENGDRGGPGWSSAYEVAHRLVGWTWTLPLVEGALTPEEREAIGRSFAEQAAFAAARPSRYSSANNHRLAELAGLLAACVAGVGADSWEPLWRELEDEAVRQTYDDGGSREQAAGYFLYVLEILWVAALFAHALGRPLGRVEERLRAMLEWLSAVARVDGEPPPVGDDAEDRLLRSDYFEPRSAAAIAGRVAALLDGAPSLEPAEVLAPSETSHVLEESGYAILRGRLGSVPVRVTVDAGELGFGSLAAHGHADALALLLDVGTRSLLRDSGTGSYAPSAGRDEFRETPAHGTVVVDGQSQAEATGPHLWGRRYRATVEAAALTPAFDYVRAAHDGYRSLKADATHTRSVLYLRPDLVIVLDRVAARRPCNATLVWQLCAGELPGRLGAGVAAMTVAGEPRPAWGRADGRFSARYASQTRAPRFTWSASGRDLVFATAVALGTGSPMPKLSVTHDGERTVVDVRSPRAVRITETWRDALAEVEA